MLKEDKYLTVDEVADRLRVGPWTVREWIAAGRLSAIKPGKQYLISQSALECFERSVGNESNGESTVS